MIKLYTVLFLSFSLVLFLISNINLISILLLLLGNKTQMSRILKYCKPCWLELIIKNVCHPNIYVLD